MVLLERSDVGRELGVAVATVRTFEQSGALPIFATTRRGCRLFRVEDVQALRRQRAARAR